MMTRGYLSIATFVLLLAAGSPLCQADLVQVNYEGVVTSVTANVSGTFTAGNTIEGVLLLDTDTSANAGATINGATFDAIIMHQFSVLSAGVPFYSASTSTVPAGMPEVQIDNAGGGFPNDRLAFLSRASDGLVGSDVGGLALNSLGIRFDDFSNTVFSTALEIPTSVSLGDFDSSAFFLFYGASLEGNALGTITSLQFTTVPEPVHGSLLLLGIMAATVVAPRRLRRPACATTA